MARCGFGAPLLLLVLPPLLLLGGCGDDGEAAGPHTIACAASLRRVVPDLLALHRQGPSRVRFQPTYGGSGTLRQQVEAGAPVCGVLLASGDDVDRLIEARRVDATTRTVLARNVLVLLGGAGAPAATFRTLVGLPPQARIAIGDPRSVPAGRYAREALERLGVWDTLQARLLPVADVAAVTTYVRRGEVALGIAYATEVVHLGGLRVLDRAEESWAPPAVVVGGACRGASGAEAFRELLLFLGSAPARAVWKTHGFLPP